MSGPTPAPALPGPGPARSIASPEAAPITAANISIDVGSTAGY